MLDVGRSVDLARSNSVSDVLGNSWVFDGRKYLFPIFTSLNITIYRVFTIPTIQIRPLLFKYFGRANTLTNCILVAITIQKK